MNDELLEYLAGAMSGPREEDFERRLFDDASLLDAASRAVDLLDGLRALSAQGPPVPIVSESALAALTRTAHVTMHEPVDGRVVAHLAGQDFVAARVPADLGDARHVDVLFCTPEGTPYFRVHDAPFTSAGLLVVCSAHVARATPLLFLRVVDERGGTRAELCIENRDG